MARVPFFLRRPSLLYQGVAVDRDRPDLDHLASIDDPEDFVWSILPHAARSFAASITMLRSDQALASAVAYLYARILDTYEDLIPDPAAQRDALMDYAARFSVEPLGRTPAIDAARVTDDRDRVHVLLVERIELVDAVFARLPAADRQSIVELVAAMADGMAWASETFEAQHGVLVSEEQRARYCHHVIGQPALFALRLSRPNRLVEADRPDALAVSEMIQMANITRDIERDLARGIAYHQDLRRWLGHLASSIERDEAVERVRRELLGEALHKVPAFGRLLQASSLPRFSRARGAAILMLLFTDRYYRRAATRVGEASWPGPTSSLALYTHALAASLSTRWANRIVGRVEDGFSNAAKRLRPAPSGLAS